MICDNTDHKGKKDVKLYPITLRWEFRELGVSRKLTKESLKCDWCDSCIARDWGMVSIKSRK